MTETETDPLEVPDASINALQPYVVEYQAVDADDVRAIAAPVVAAEFGRMAALFEAQERQAHEEDVDIWRQAVQMLRARVHELDGGSRG